MTKRRALGVVAAMAVALAGCTGRLRAAEPPPPAAGPKAPEAKAVTGKVVAVTLYRGQALVTRTVEVDAAAGQVELPVTGLPLKVVADSLFAEAGEGLEVRAVRFRTRAVGEEPREEVRKLEEQIEAAQAEVGRNKKMQKLVADKLSYLDKLEGFTVPTSKVEMAKGVLNVDTVKQITLFAFAEREKLTVEGLKLEGEAREIGKKIALLQRQRRELASGSSRTVREALVFLEKRAAAKGEIKLSYLVQGAGWSPAYNFRTNADRTKLDVEYNAVIQQMSGEDWQGVELTLSTASPAMSAEGPGLAPFRVALGKGRPGQRGKLVERFKQSQGRLRGALAEQRAAQDLAHNRGANWRMISAVNESQNIELIAGRDTFQSVGTEARGGAQGPSVSYKLKTAVSLASRSDQQMLRILDTKLDTAFYYVATPILTSYVYREAKVLNTGSEVLLAGPVSVYLDGRFVGRGEVPTVAQGEDFVMGFGVDPQLRARRERVDREERVQGGNREIAVKYSITLENYKDAKAVVRVLDRKPVSDRDADVRVTVGEMSDKLSADKIYERLEKPKGILRWEIEVPGKAGGESARILTYGYRIEFDRTLALGAPSGAKAAALEREFQDLQFRRQGR